MQQWNSIVKLHKTHPVCNKEKLNNSIQTLHRKVRLRNMNIAHLFLKNVFCCRVAVSLMMPTSPFILITVKNYEIFPCISYCCCWTLGKYKSLYFGFQEVVHTTNAFEIKMSFHYAIPLILCCNFGNNKNMAKFWIYSIVLT